MARARPATLLAILVVAATSTACAGVEISLTLEPGPDSVTGGLTDTTTIKELHIKLTSPGEPDEDQEIAASAVKQTTFSVQHVDNKHPVTIDVRGCETPNAC